MDTTKSTIYHRQKFCYDWKMLPVVFALAGPTMLEQLMQTAVQYIDTAMVGSLGTMATAAVGATSTVNWLIGGTISAFSVGFLAYIAQSFGAGERKRAKRAAAQAALMVVIIGFVVTMAALALGNRIPIWMQAEPDIQPLAANYFKILYLPMLFRTASIIFGTVLRAAGDTKTPMKIGLIVNLLNVVLNFFLIYPGRLSENGCFIPGAGLGVEGAAIASAVAYMFGGIAMTWKLWRHKEISPCGQRFLPDMEILKPCLKVSMPVMLQQFMTSMGYVVFAAMINSLGEISTAAHTIANTVESAFYIPGWGMQTAAATLSGNAFGAGDKEKLRRLGRTMIPLEIILMAVSGGLLFLFAPQLMHLFSKDAEVIALGTAVLRMVAVSEPFYGVPIVIEGMMQGTGKTMTPFVYNVFGMWCARIVGTFICTQIFSFGLISAWACMIAHNLLLFVLFIIHYVSGRWNPMHKI